MNVRLDPLARCGLLRAADYYEKRRPGLGDEFLDDIAKGLVLLKQFPDAGAKLSDRVRRLLLTRFPYGIIYRADPAGIVIFAVAHAKRKPRYWQSRTRRA